MRHGLFILILLTSLPAAASPPESGMPLSVGLNRTGPLSSQESYKTFPVGMTGDSLFVLAPAGLKQGLYRYRCVDESVPLFAAPVPVEGPWSKAAAAATGTIFELNGEIYYAWLEEKELVIARFDSNGEKFISFRRRPCPFNASSIVFAGTDHGDWVFFASRTAPAVKKFERSPVDQSSFYDGAGVFRGNWARSGVYQFSVGDAVSEPELINAAPDELLGATSLAVWPPGAVASNVLGAFWHVSGGKAARIFCGDALMRHPTQGARAVAWGQKGLIAGGEGALRLYPFSGQYRPDGSPVFHAPKPVLEKDANLFGGTLTVPVLCDWDGDGATDIIAGNSEGRVLFFKNHGSSQEPAFAPGVELEAGGAPIHIQPGYYGVQGPFEARWGYTCPTVVDWNGDGLPDILMSDSTARYRLYLNTGTRTKPALDRERLLKLDGLELHGTWRVKPGATKLGTRMACVILDDENDFHLYWRLDDENVADGGKLRWQDGRVMTAWALGNLQPGQRGRGKISLADWDGDGKTDILFGSMRRHCLPGPLKGLPWSRFSRGEHGMQLLFLRNIGSNEAPVFAFPKQFQFRGEDRYFGSHTSSGDAGDLGDASAGPNLILGVESGRIYFFDRRDLTFADINTTVNK